VDVQFCFSNAYRRGSVVVSLEYDQEEFLTELDIVSPLFFNLF
jgi:hypothetical protein